MGRQVTFDYSRAASFVSQEEVGYMKKLALDAKELLTFSIKSFFSLFL